jgi:signal peptidase I
MMSKSESSTPAAFKKPWYREYAEALFVAAILALIIRTFVVQAFKIPSGSMEDTLLIGDHLLVNKFLYGVQVPFVDGRYLTIRHPERGDVIVFEFPEDEGKNFFQRRDFIKRIVGLPGDTVEVLEKKVLVNGVPYHIPQEIHKEDNIVTPGFGPRDFMPAIEVPEGHYFVMGDNRDRSYDSRFWGFVEESKIKGLAFIKYWSWDSQANWLKKIRWNRLGRPIE